MQDPANIAQNGGAAVAMGSAVLGFANQAMGWLNHNSAGILALCGIGGFLISVAGFVAKRRHMAKLLEHELRMKERRAS